MKRTMKCPHSDPLCDNCKKELDAMYLTEQQADDREVTADELVQVLTGFFDWSTRYMEAARMNDEALMKRLDEEFDPEELVYSVTRKDAPHETS